MSSIFVSHSSRDQKSAEILGQWLQEQGHTSYFLDFDPDKGIAAGKHWEDELYRHLRLCRAVIALLSPNWLESRWCFAEVSQARAAGKPVLLAKVAPCDTDGLFSDIQQVDLTLDPAEGYQRLARGLQEVGIKPGEAFEWDPSRPPYPGLLAFQEEDAAIFFGRDQEIQKSLEMLESLRRRDGPSFILCLGASGSGKSSLIRAGLIPHLRKQPDTWLPITPCRPQEDPLEELAIQLAQTFAALGERRDWQSIHEQLYAPYSSDIWRSAPDTHTLSGKGLAGLARDLRVLAGKQDATVLMAIDQAEELFGYSHAQSSRAFLQCLRGALEMGGHRLMALATMRSDSLGSFQMHPELQEFSYEPLTVAPIPLRELPQIIQGPAHLADIALEPGLVQTLVQDATTSDALPLLAFTLRELYERYGQDRRLVISEYEDLGRLEGSIRHAADMVIDTLLPSAEELAALRMAFVPAMVSVNEEGEFVRRRARWLDLPARAQSLLQGFIDSRLLVSREVEGERVIEVAHEALLRVWPRLNGWLREDRDNLRILDDLRHASGEWHAHNREESWLVHYGERLEAVEAMLRLPQFGEQINPTAKEYLNACIEKRQKELEAEARAVLRKRRFVIAISVIAIVAIGAAAFGWYQRGVAEEERDHALIAQSKALSMVSRQKTDEGQATLGMLLSLKALPGPDGEDRPFVPDAEASLLYAIFAQREKQVLSGHRDGINRVAVSPNGSFVVTGSRDRTARIWDVATGEVTVTLQSHGGQVYWVEFSPDGKQVLTASSDKTARIWNAETGKVLFTLEGHEEDVFQATFSRDGRHVATASADNTARLWDAETGKAVFVLEGHTKEVYRASFSPNGRHLVTASGDGTSRLWNVATGKSLVTLEGHDQAVLQAAFSPDGQRIVTASWDGTARLWDVTTGKRIATLKDHKAGVSRALFSPNGKLVVTASADDTARLWDSITGHAIGVLKGHQGQIHDAQFSPDGRWLVTVGDDGTARLWNVLTGNTVDIFGGHIGRVWTALFLPDGRHVATASEDATARIWEVAPNTAVTELKGHTDRVHRAIFSPDGHRLVTVSDDKRALIWNGETGDEIVATMEHEGQVWYSGFSQDGRYLVTTSTDGSARLWEAATGRLLHRLEGHDGMVNHAHFSPDGQQVVTGGRDESARVWDVKTGKVVFLLPGHEGPVNFVEFSHDGVRILTASQDGKARLWNAANGELIALLEGHQGPIINGAFSPDDGLLVTVSWDKTARLWDGVSGEPYSVLEGHEDAILSATFSPNSRLVVTASSDNTGRIWDATNGKPMPILQGHKGEVYDASFSPDGRLILTASGDGTARLWHVVSGRPVSTLKGHGGPVVSAKFDSAGRWVITASWDHTARLWMLPLGAGDDWIEYARDKVPRKLTADEQRLYLEEIDSGE